VFGDYFVQLGAWGGPDLFAPMARTRHHVLLGVPDGDKQDALVWPDRLAIATDSVDVVFLPHLLETSANPHGVLREVDRILRPEGQLVVMGFNPIGWWGLRHLVARKGYPPGIKQLISGHRLNDWLRLLNYRVLRTDYYHSIASRYGSGADAEGSTARAGAQEVPPEFANVSSIDARRALPAEEQQADSFRRNGRHGRIEGARLFIKDWRNWSALAGGYILLARKEIFPVNPIRASIKRRRRLVQGLVNPTTRNAA
jgi:SAM-dependent methyltransferase